jgi:tRNA threonylcarbamoyladenosine biosynthesis protein TsaB
MWRVRTRQDVGTDRVEYTIAGGTSPVVILALDTTSRSGSAAVFDDESALATLVGDAARTHAERLPAELERVLADAGRAFADLGLLAVAVGPGAFTGLRIGLAAMQGLALALGRPIAGVSALEALHAAARAATGTEGPVATWMDAGRGEVFAAFFDRRDGVEVTEALVGRPDDILAGWHTRLAPAPAVFIGDGAGRYAGAIGSAASAIVPAPALAPWIARLGRAAALRGLAGSPHALQPLYVRRPDAELERERRAAP